MVSRIVIAFVLVSAATAKVASENINNAFNSYQDSRYQQLEQPQNPGWSQYPGKNLNNYQEIQPEELREIQYYEQNQNQASPLNQDEAIPFQYNQHQVPTLQEALGVLQHQPQNNDIKEHEPIEHHLPAKYHFRYFVHDEKTGDIKAQEEARNGDELKGRYSVVQPDGLRRIVEYFDASHGFNAHVRYEPVH